MIHAEGDYCASCVKWHDLLNSINMTVTPREVQPQKNTFPMEVVWMEAPIPQGNHFLVR